jgi:hypothetical protein
MIDAVRGLADELERPGPDWHPRRAQPVSGRPHQAPDLQHHQGGGTGHPAARTCTGRASDAA